MFSHVLNHGNGAPGAVFQLTGKVQRHNMLPLPGRGAPLRLFSPDEDALDESEAEVSANYIAE